MRPFEERNYDQSSAHTCPRGQRTRNNTRRKHRPAQAMALPVTSAHEIAGAAPTEHVQWWGLRRAGWGGYGWGWRRPYYGGGALAAGLVGGLALGTLAA